MKNWLAKLGKTIGVRTENPRNSYRLLTEQDIGKVFIAKDLTPHQNFGKYKILISVHTPGLYAFNTFDIVDGSPQGKFLVSHPARPIYQEVSIAPDMLEKASIEIKKANARLGEQIRNAIQVQNTEH